MSWLLGLKGALRGGLSKIAEAMQAEKALNRPAMAITAGKEPGIWTGMEGLQRTVIPRTDTQLKIVPSQNKVYRIPDLVEVPKDFHKAYPELDEVAVKVYGKLPGGAGGLTYPEQNLIELGLSDGYSPIDPRALLQHEITHLIPQRLEGFATGASPRAVQNQIAEYYKMLANGVTATDPTMQKNALFRVNNQKLYPRPTDPEQIEREKMAVYKAHSGETEARFMEQPMSIEDIIAQITRPSNFKRTTPYKIGGLAQVGKVYA